MTVAFRWMAPLIFVAAAQLGACGGASPRFTGTGGSGPGGAEASGGGGGVAIDAPETGGEDGSAGAQGGTGGGGEDGNADSADGGHCHAVVQQQADEQAAHTANNCDPVTYNTNPPSSGTHYPNWAAYRLYDKPVPWGFLVHQLEHGAVVISYRCAPGCKVDLTGVQAFLAMLPPDDICLSRKMITVVPDPDLDVAFAASAWTWTLRADCFDAAAFDDFVAQHYGHGRERVCSDGIDLSASGWCP